MLCFKEAGQEDAEALAEMIRRSFQAQADILRISQQEFPNFVGFETPERVRQRLGDGEQTVFALADGVRIGTIGYKADPDRPGWGFLRRLAVLPEFRGNGYGERLIDFAESRLKEQGVHVVELSIVAQFERLQRYYERLGYRPLSRKSFPTVPFEALFMEKKL